MQPIPKYHYISFAINSNKGLLLTEWKTGKKKIKIVVQLKHDSKKV